MDPLHIFTPLAHMQFQPSALRLGWKEFKSKEEKEQKKNKDFALFMILYDSLALLFGPGARAHFRNLLRNVGNKWKQLQNEPMPSYSPR